MRPRNGRRRTAASPPFLLLESHHSQCQRRPLRREQGPVPLACRAAPGPGLPAGNEVPAGRPRRQAARPEGFRELPCVRREEGLQRRRALQPQASGRGAARIREPRVRCRGTRCRGALRQAVDLWLVGVLVLAAVAFLGIAGPDGSLYVVAVAAVTLRVAGATFDIIIDAYRIELLEPRQLGVGSGMSQYGWRIGAAAAGALALVLASRLGWTAAYVACAVFALPAMLVGVLMGEPRRHREPAKPHGIVEAIVAYFSPLIEFLRRQGALVVLLFVLIHKIGDTLANLTLRLLFQDLGFTNDEVAFYDVGVGFIALLVGIFVGGVLYARLGMKRAVLLSLILMAVSNLSFAALAAAGHTNLG